MIVGDGTASYQLASLQFKLSLQLLHLISQKVSCQVERIQSKGSKIPMCVLPSMNGVLRMQELQYLNIAINNITRIENLHRCESLTRLDLTMNFVDKSALGSVDNLCGLIFLRELHLLGNPCTQWSLYREYVIAMLPQLQLLVRHKLKGDVWLLASLIILSLAVQCCQ